MRISQFNISIYICIFLLTVSASAISNEGVLYKLQEELSELVEIAKPSVVTISSKTSLSIPSSKDNGLFSLFSDEEENKTVSYKMICTGLIYNDEGYIITKSREVKSSKEISVTLHNGKSYHPVYIGYDPTTEISLLKIDAENLVVPKLNLGAKINPGEWVAVIGNSMGCSSSLSLGLINGYIKDDMFQFSATVSPGNSGSPIFNIQGNVVGILTAQVEPDHSAQRSGMQNMLSNTGVALSIDKVSEVIDDLIDTHKNNTGWLGVSLNEHDFMDDHLVIENVIPNSPAQKSGLMEGDILLTYNNENVKSANQLGHLIKNTAPGKTVTINILRRNTRLNVFVEIARRNQLTYDDGHKQSARPYNKSIPVTNNTGNNRVFRKDMNYLQNRVNHLEQEIKQLKNKIDKQSQK